MSDFSINLFRVIENVECFFVDFFVSESFYPLFAHILPLYVVKSLNFDETENGIIVKE